MKTAISQPTPTAGSAERHHRMTQPVGLLAAVLLLALVTCENRLPVEPESDRPAESLLLTVDTDDAVIAQLDTVKISVLLVDTNMNVIADTFTIPLRARSGLLFPLSGEGSGTNEKSEYLYYFPYDIDEVHYDTLTAWYLRPGKQDTLRASGVLTIKPRAAEVGYLEPAYVSVEIRTDSVYKSGGSWAMFVDAKVSDPMGNPVESGHTVVFSLEESGIDTSLLALHNLARTGDTTVIQLGQAGEVYQVQADGDAISVLSYESKAVDKTVILRGTLAGDSSITDLDTLLLPLPTCELELTARYIKNTSMHVPLGESDTAVLRISLQDAFNVPIPGRRIRLTASPGGDVLPLCPVYDGNGAIVTSRVCTCDTVFADSCILRDSLNPDIVVMTCHDYDTVYNCTPLPEPATGITDESGEFIARILVDGTHRENKDTELQELTVTLHEEESGVTAEVKIPVTFEVR